VVADLLNGLEKTRAGHATDAIIAIEKIDIDALKKAYNGWLYLSSRNSTCYDYQD
jgi:hypothetical protein